MNTPDRRTRSARIDEKSMHSSGNTSVGIKSNQAQEDSLDISLSPANSLKYTGQVDLTPDERWYLEFFRQNTSMQCAGYFYDEFWQRLVHQVSDTQPAVCHAVIAMGSLNYRFLRSRMGGISEPLNTAFPLQQCNKAIVHLRQNLTNGHMTRLRMETALVTCVILVSMMLLQEDAQSAGRHLRSGYKLLEDYLREAPHPSSTGFALSQALAGINLGWLSFSSSDSATEDGDGSFACFRPMAHSHSETLDDIQRASNFLLTLAPLVLSGNAKRFQTAQFDIDSEAHAILGKLRGWRNQVQRLSMHDPIRLSQRDLDALTLLEIWSEALYIILMVKTASLSLENNYDEYLPRFQNVVSLAKKLLTSDPSQTSLPKFSVNMGIIPPLFFCAFRCRDWLVRQEALLLLRRWRRQEGIWSSGTTALILKRVIEIESDGLTPEDPIPEMSRIVSIDVELCPPDSKLCLRYRRGCNIEANPWVSEYIKYESADFGDAGTLDQGVRNN